MSGYNSTFIRVMVALGCAIACLEVLHEAAHAQQVPQAITYQAAVRDSLGLPIASRPIHVRASIVRGTAGGPALYTETHETRTDDLGLFVIMLGQGTAVQGTFSAIDWSRRDYWLKIELDQDGGESFVDLGAQQLLSVPFALFAQRSAYSDTAKVALRTLNVSPGGSGDSLTWRLGGNIGIDHSKHFIGTGDSADVVIRTNGAERVRVTADGRLTMSDLSGGGSRVVVTDAVRGGMLGSRLLRDLVDDDFIHQIDSSLVRDSVFLMQIVRRIAPWLGHDSVFVRELTRDSVFRFRVLSWVRTVVSCDSVFITAVTHDSVFIRNVLHHVDTLLRIDSTGGFDSLQINRIMRRLDTLLARDSLFIRLLTNDSLFTERVRVIGDSRYWNMQGNRGTSPARNFLGTTDDQPLAIRTGNVERVRVAAGSGFVGIGTTSPSERLHVAGAMRADGLGGNGVRLVVADPGGRLDANTNVSALLARQVDTVLARDVGFITSLVTNSAFISNLRTIGDTMYWSLTGARGTDPTRNFLGTSDDRPLAIRTGDIERVRIAAGNGFVGIGTALPSERLHVAGAIRADGLSGNGLRLVVADAGGRLDANTNVSTLLARQVDTVLARDTGFITSLVTNSTFISNLRSVSDTMYWSLSGSRGTDPSQNYLGTSDNQPLAIRTGDVERVRIAAGSGFVGIGTTSPSERLHVAGGIRVDDLGGSGPRLVVADANGRMDANMNVSALLARQVDTVLARDAGFITSLVTNSTFISNLRTIGDTMYWSLSGSRGTDPSQNYLGTSDDQPLAIRTGDVERVRIASGTGFVGIGTASPSERLHLQDGNLLIGNTNNVPGELRLQEPSGSGNNYIALRARPLSSNLIFEFPDTQGPPNTVLTNDGAGGLRWADAATLVGNGLWSVNGNSGLANNLLGTLDDTPIRFITGTGGPNERMRIDVNGNVGIGTTAPAHHLDVTSDATADEAAAIRGTATGATGTQAVGVWGSANNTGAGNTGTIAMLATGNGNTTAGGTNVAMQVNDGELTLGRTTETAPGYTVVEPAGGGVNYTAEGPSGVIEIDSLGSLLGLLDAGQTVIVSNLTVNNRYVTPNSIILLQVLETSGNTLDGLLNLTFSTLVDNRVNGAFNMSVSAHMSGMFPLVLGATDALRVGYVVINPSR